MILSILLNVLAVIGSIYLLASVWMSGVSYAAIVDEWKYMENQPSWRMHVWVAVGMIVFWPFLVYSLYDGPGHELTSWVILKLFDVE